MTGGRKAAHERALDAGVRAYYLGPGGDEAPLTEVKALHRAIEAAIAEWETHAPPRGDGYDCAGTCAHHCGR